MDVSFIGLGVLHSRSVIKKLYIADNDKTFEPNKKDKFDRTVLAAYLWGMDLTQALSMENK